MEDYLGFIGLTILSLFYAVFGYFARKEGSCFKYDFFMLVPYINFIYLIVVGSVLFVFMVKETARK